MNKIYQSIPINKILLPLSWLYGLIVYFRNKFFDWGIFKQESFDIPIICIGNITVGGTGKTPHTEYLVNLLRQKYRVAVLSRGYGRKTKGFILSDEHSTSLTIGDEPFQIKQKFPNIIVAVDGNRRRGIHYLLELENPPEVILLDDAFQHRYVKPSFSILLSNFNRPMQKDKLLPAGRLRESFSNYSKANMIIVSKCPVELKPIDYRIISNDIHPYPYQSLFFTKYVYKKLVPVFGNKKKVLDLDSLKDKDILLVTGIASPKMIIKLLENYTNKIEEMTFPDHHTFKTKDIKSITKRFEEIISKEKIILVTEKDATRLIIRDDIDKSIQDSIYSLPIEVSFEDAEEEFDNKILKHVRENTRNSRFYQE